MGTFAQREGARIPPNGSNGPEALAPEERNDVAAAVSAAEAGGKHQIFLGFEQNVSRSLNRAIDAKLLRVAAIELTEEMNDAPPDVCRNQLELRNPALLDGAEQLIGFTKLMARGGGGSSLPGPETMLGDLENGSLDHGLRRHDNPRMEERVDGEQVYPGKLFQVYRDRVRLPNGKETTREIVRHPGSVAMIPRHADGRIVLVRQFRYVAGRELWEIPAGTMDKPGEDTLAAARRELAEEAGLKAQKWTMLGKAYLMPGYCDELMTFFLAQELSPTEAHAEMDESFKVNPFDVHDLQVLRSTGELLDAKTLLGLAWAGVPLWDAPSRRS